MRCESNTSDLLVRWLENAKKNPQMEFTMVESAKNHQKTKQKIPEFSCFSYRNLKEKEGVKCPLLTLKLGGLDPPSPTKEVILL